MGERSDIVYLDYAAATPMSDGVLKAMAPFAQSIFYNPSALYSGARDAKSALEQARARVARTIGARPSEIIFTAGGTESANLAIHGVMSAFPEGELVVSAIEHDAVLKPAQARNARIIGVDAAGRVQLEALKQAITDSTVLISIMYANNEVGTVQPIDEVVALVAEERARRRVSGNTMPLYVHTDACQAPLYLDINIARLGVDLMTLNGGKLFGPKQSGILFHKTGVRIEPHIRGGGQEYGLRSGTENVGACVGFAQALSDAVEQRAEAVAKVRKLADMLRTSLETVDKTCIFNGHPRLRLPNTVHVTFPGHDNERMLFSLDDQGVFAAAGSACSASNDEPSHVLRAMGVSDEDARASLRFSMSSRTTEQEIKRAVKSLAIALKA
ncbi:MAG TPA: cysteine desulfurase family protein [Candidatus Saccharibacteria bacterium]|nr:cysteine desulfurase family protein [Candidatus Saccharibacteria bacterium]